MVESNEPDLPDLNLKNKDDEDDDILLSQALDAHQQKEKEKNKTQSNYIPQTPSPPAKKVS